MEHKLIPADCNSASITVIEHNTTVVVIKITENGIDQPIALNKKELHSLIGTLLHVQQKMK